jgi:hypothetical protein
MMPSAFLAAASARPAANGINHPWSLVNAMFDYAVIASANLAHP